MQTTSTIASYKHVSTNGRDLVIVTTKSGAVIWVAKSQFNEQAQTITFESRKAGDKYTNTKTGEEGVLKADRNDFIGCGRDTSTKFEVLDYLISKGITPTFAM